jgi:two-component system response regulator RpfG
MQPRTLAAFTPAPPFSIGAVVPLPRRGQTIVVVDDMVANRLLLAEMLRQLEPGSAIESFESPAEALRFAAESAVDLVVTDYSMPEFDGIELTRRLRALPGCADVPIVMVTIVEDRRVRHAALEAGATDFLTKPVDAQEIKARCKNLLQLRRQQLMLRDQTRHLQGEIDKAVAMIHARELETLLVLAKAGEYRDECTGNHIARIAKYSALIGARLGLTSERVHVLEVAAPMHDIGKIGVPDSILLKRTALTPEEMASMREHPQIGYDILKGSPSKYLRTGAVIALGHHERFDGGGYPAGLRGARIPIEARIVAVADVFDALITRRPYKDPWPIANALDYLSSQRGKHFDPACVDAFMEAIADVERIAEELKDTSPHERPEV